MQNQAESSRTAIRKKIIEDLLTDISLNDETLARALSHTGQREVTVQNDGIPGMGYGLRETNLAEECEGIEPRVVEELDRLIESVYAFILNRNDIPVESPEDLPRRIRAVIDEVRSLREELDLSYENIKTLADRIRRMQQQLQDDLRRGLETYPPILEKKRAAEDTLTATTIETSLIKLSLMRAQCHRTLYGFKSPSHPNTTMTNALQAAHTNLEEEGDDLMEEERALDSQLSDYHRLLKNVDEDVGFGQLLDDWMRIQRESADCRRDLRRLGWSEGYDR